MHLAQSAIAGAAFLKMQGAGNDFVVIDRRRAGATVDAASARALADRATGVGCDQIVLVDPDVDADARMTILNADGSPAEACGNAARCVAKLVLEETGADAGAIRTTAGALPIWRAEADRWGVDMGLPRFDWADIPLAEPYDGDRMAFRSGPFADPTPLSMGNPHAVFFVDALDDDEITAHGPRIETDPAFPARVNAGFARVDGRDRIRLRVWERGAGLTRACGSGACAALVAAVKRGLTDRAAAVAMDGGTLRIEWRAGDEHVLMIGPAALSFTGRIAEAAA
ncbi:MAG: diaminopimelate epimerase [Pseudomonadota bacterium]